MHVENMIVRLFFLHLVGLVFRKGLTFIQRRETRRWTRSGRQSARALIGDRRTYRVRAVVEFEFLRIRKRITDVLQASEKTESDNDDVIRLDAILPVGIWGGAFEVCSLDGVRENQRSSQTRLGIERRRCAQGQLTESGMSDEKCELRRCFYIDGRRESVPLNCSNLA